MTVGTDVASDGGRAEQASPAGAPTRHAAANAEARRRRVRRDLIVLALVGVLLLAATAAGIASMYRAFYSPTAFVERYLNLVADGQAADALATPGVAITTADLDAAGLPSTASDALLRSAALTDLTDIETVQVSQEGDLTSVTVSYEAGGFPGTTTFEVERDGWIGVAPAWRFSRSPLAVMDVDVYGSLAFDVNGFELDKRQVLPDGAEGDLTQPASLLVLSPGLYRVSVDTPIASTPGVAVLSDAPLADVAVEVHAQPTDEFVEVVQNSVDDFLTACTTQEVLQPTGCPFGYVVDDRIQGLPSWSMSQYPEVSLEQDGTGWALAPSEGVAHVDVDVQSLFDGTVSSESVEIPFTLEGSVTMLPDGSASIRVH